MLSAMRLVDQAIGSGAEVAVVNIGPTRAEAPPRPSEAARPLALKLEERAGDLLPEVVRLFDAGPAPEGSRTSTAREV